MTIASKNGGLILKGGALATNCGCCGWYCSTPTCPCKYAKPMPDALQASLAFSLPGNMYGIALGNFQQAVLSTWRVTPQDASTVNGTYTMTRPQPTGSPCFYRYNSGGIDIRLVVGESSGSFNFESLNAGCSENETNVHLSYLGLFVPAMFPEEFWSSVVNNICPGHPSFINNAASRTYTRQQTTVSCPGTTNQSWNQICNWQPPFPLYNLGFRLDGSPGGRDTPACLPVNLTQINHSWAFDVIYTDTSGPFPAEGRIPRAVTLTISE